MKVNFTNFDSTFNAYNSVTGQQNLSSSQPSFEGAKSKKFLKEILNAKSLRKIKATFQDMIDAYKELGYDVILKRGSHAIVPVSEDFNIPLIIPHKDKCVSPFDIKRLKLVMLGKLEEAKNVH